MKYSPSSSTLPQPLKNVKTSLSSWQTKNGRGNGRADLAEGQFACARRRDLAGVGTETRSSERPAIAPSSRRCDARTGPGRREGRNPSALPRRRPEPSLRSECGPPLGVRVAGPGAARTGLRPAQLDTRKGLCAPLIRGASRASATKGVSTLSPSPVSMVTCSAPIQTAVLY